ncbi:MAG: phosphotransferase [Pseudomonadota bacterium]
MPGASASEAATNRAEALSAFLAAAGWGAAERRPLAGDASNRRYERVRRADGFAAVLMDAPPEKGEIPAAFLAMTGWLRGLGFSAPEVIAADPSGGFALLEDLGDALYARVVAETPALETPAYAAAVDLLARLHAHPPPATLPVEDAAPHRPGTYDDAAYAAEASLFPDWYMPGATGAVAPPDLRAEILGLVGEACAGLAPEVMALRDYHAENLIWLPERAGTARVGLLDYQDALAGHRAYDLVSLLEDARRDTSAALRDAMLARYIAAAEVDAEAFSVAYAALGAQRNLKILGIFARLAQRDGKPAYLAHMPRVWDHLMRDLAAPAPPLRALAALIARHVPPPDATARARLAARP